MGRCHQGVFNMQEHTGRKRRSLTNRRREFIHLETSDQRGFLGPRTYATILF